MSDDEYNYDYDNYNYEQDQMEVEDNEAIELENNFNMAEDEWRNNPDEAYRLFTLVIEKEKAKPLDGRKWSFKSYNFMILMGIQKRINEVELTTYIQGFLELLDKQFKSEGDKALKMVVDALMNSNDGHLISTVLPGLLKRLHAMNQIGVYCSASMKLCKDYYQRKDSQKLAEIISNVESTLAASNIQDEDRKKAIQAEVLAYRVLLCNITQQFDQIKHIYRQLIRANLDLLEPYIVGVINSTVGQQKSLERQYEQGRKKLMEAFYNFQDASSSEAKQSLVYGSVVSILENFKMNVFDDMRSKVYDQDPYVETFKELRIAYEQQNVQVFSNIINSDYFKSDKFLQQLRPYMQQIIVECKILRYAKCYKTIKLEYLSKQLMIDIPVLQKYIQGLITKKQFNGLIDEVAGYIEIRGDEEENQTKALKIIVDQIKSIDW